MGCTTKVPFPARTEMLLFVASTELPYVPHIRKGARSSVHREA